MSTSPIQRSSKRQAQDSPDRPTPKKRRFQLDTLDHSEFKWNPPPEDRPARIYADGVFDLFHIGHAQMLRQAKTTFPNVTLIVGVVNDELTHRLKGRTVFNEKQRYESVRHCRWVDEVIEDAPWILTEEFLKLHQIDYVCHDPAPYTIGDSEDVYAFVKKKGMFIPTRRTEGVSTTDIIVRLIRDYEEYVQRNLERGVTRQDMNVSYLKEKEVKLKREIQKVENKVDKFIHTSVENFVRLFGHGGVVSEAISRQRKKLKDGFQNMAKFSAM